MARLQKFKGTQALPGVGSPQVIADTAVGVATAKLGPRVARSAANIGELAGTALKFGAKKHKEAELDQRRAQRGENKGDAPERLAARADDLAYRRNAFAGKKTAEKLQLEVRHRLAAPTNGSSQTPAPLADEMVAFMKATEDKILTGLPREQKQSFETASGRGEDQLRTEIATAEYRRDKDYFLDGLQQSKDLAVETIHRLPDSIDQVFDHYLDLVDTAALPKRLKEQSIHNAGREMLEAWVKAHPPATQIAELSKLQAGKPGGAVSNSKGAIPSVSKHEVHTSFAARAVALPDVSRNRLLANALRQQANETLVEQARIVERIDTTHEQVDPLEITANALLGPEERLQLLRRLREAIATRSRDVSALQQLAAVSGSDPRRTDSQRLVNEVFSYLNDGKTDPVTLARGIAVSSLTLPRAAGKTLATNLASENGRDVMQALTTLSVLNRDAVENDLDGAEGGQVRTLLAGETYLTEERGFSREAVGGLVAKANQLKTRKERLENFAALYSVKRSAKATLSPLLV